MKPFGIEKQVLLVALIPVLLMTVLLSNYFIFSRFGDLDEALDERSQLLVKQLASSSEYAVFSNNRELLQQEVDTVLTQQDVKRVVVLDESLKPVIEKSRPDLVQFQSPLPGTNESAPVYKDANILVVFRSIVATQIKLTEFDFSSVVKTVAAKPLGAVIIEFSKANLNRQKQQILLFSLALTLIILTVSSALALWAARKITRPILDMSQVLQRFGDGDLNSRVVMKSKVPELTMLSSGFNQMAGKLQQHQQILETTVTERTSALRASEQEYRTLIENTPDTVARYDKDCRRTYINPAFSALAQSDLANLLGKRPSENLYKANAEVYENKIKEVFATGKNVRFEVKWLNTDGKEICSHMQLTPERDLSGKIISVLSVGHDITELNETKIELQRKELAKSRFLAAAGHDLRQPLAAANLFIDALKLTDPSEKQNLLIRRLDQSMSNFNGLLNTLLDVSKLDGGAIKPEYTIFPVVEIFTWIEQTFAAAANKKQLRFKLHFPMRDALAIRTDIGLLKSILMNLITNATKFTAQGGILVSARRRGDHLLFQVWDTGIGISDEHIKHIFDEFYQINNPQRDRTQGLGLGLYIAKRSLALFDGDIRCYSKAGRGTVFEFQMPCTDLLNETHSGGTESVLDQSAQVKFVSGKNIVVLEDDLLVADALSGIFEAMGAKVKVFSSAEDALAETTNDHTDFFIVDYMLEGKLNGIQFLNEISQVLHKPVKAIVVSGDTSAAFAREIKNSNWTVIHKPVNASQIITRLSERYSW
jgi:two-component system CheB/CheR fusion protein